MNEAVRTGQPAGSEPDNPGERDARLPLPEASAGGSSPAEPTAAPGPSSEGALPEPVQARIGQVEPDAPASQDALTVPVGLAAPKVTPLLAMAAPAPVSWSEVAPPRTRSLAAAPAWLPRALPSIDLAKPAAYLPIVRRWLGLALRVIAGLALGLVALVLMLVVLYRWVDPPISALMLGQRLAGTEIERAWVPLKRISPHLIRAVVLSEDGGFCRHRGVDWGAIEEALESDRGGSTITMQVVKNLFLWPSRSYVRKVLEICLAYAVDALWPKRRILEIYLNIAEWGDGVFGAEAAALNHFGKRAGRLTAEEAALLAVALPSPIERRPGAPSLGTSRLASRLLARMAGSRADLACVGVSRQTAKQPPLVQRR